MKSRKSHEAQSTLSFKVSVHLKEAYCCLNPTTIGTLDFMNIDVNHRGALKNFQKDQ